MNNAFYNMIMQAALNTPAPVEKDTSGQESKSDQETNNQEPVKKENVVIPIIHNEVSQLSKYLDIKEPQINFKTLTRVKDIIYDTKNKDIDLLIDSNGGEINAAKMICDTLMTYKKLYPENKIRAYVEYSALSAATLIALCADELYLSDYAHMGLVDPQVFGFSNKELNEATYQKGSSCWDITHALKIRSDFNTKLIKRLLNNILSKNSKYSSRKDDIIENLVDGEVHGAGFTVDDLESFGISRDDHVPDEIAVKFEESRYKHKETNTNLITSLIN